MRLKQLLKRNGGCVQLTAHCNKCKRPDTTLWIDLDENEIFCDNLNCECFQKFNSLNDVEEYCKTNNIFLK